MVQTIQLLKSQRRPLMSRLSRPITVALALCVCSAAAFMGPPVTLGVRYSNGTLPFGSPRNAQARVDAHIARAVRRSNPHTAAAGSLGDAPSSSRFAILNRALLWVFLGIPYCECGSLTCCGTCNYCDSYRCDCSGYVSYALGLPPGYTTFTLPQVTYPIDQSQLAPGDIILNIQDHVVLFAGWTDSSQTQYNAYEEAPGSNCDTAPAHYGPIPYPYYGQPNYAPYRWSGVQEGWFGLDFSAAVDSDTVDCMLDAGFNMYLMSVFQSVGGGSCDKVGIANVQLLQQTNGIVVWPLVTLDVATALSNPARNATLQTYEAMYCGDLAGIASPLYFLSFFAGPEWSTDCNANEALILAAVGEVWNYYDTVGIQTSETDWNSINCPNSNLGSRLDALAASKTVTGKGPAPRTLGLSPSSGKAYVLWYTDWNNTPNFDDFTPFGVFQSPLIKMYSGMTTVCNVPVGIDWCPGLAP